jgi:polyhydroxyalkanoate synthase
VALAYLKAKNDDRIASATFLTTMIDFSEPGELGVFIDKAQISNLENRMAEKGYLDGQVLMATFNLLRSNELFWPYFVNNYLCGKSPFAFDLLYWNSDGINLPEKMFNDYLQNMYVENRLCQGEFRVGDSALDLSTVDTPSYFFATEQDHIAPWQAVFSGVKTMQGPMTFVLGGSGHIAGVVNPPSSKKYNYRFSEDDPKIYISADEWLNNANQAEGSWWDHWEEWLKNYAGKLCQARLPGMGKLPIIQDAPGDYVKRKL